jgi:hypothetical protein
MVILVVYNQFFPKATQFERRTSHALGEKGLKKEVLLGILW